MGLFNQIFGDKEENEYRGLLREVYNPIADRIDGFSEKEIKDFFKVILDAAERSLRGILFMSPEEFNFKKKITKEEIDFWLCKVSLALVAYSYYFFSLEEPTPLTQLSYKMYWLKMFDSYNKIFDENITIDDINYYAAGLEEDTEKSYSKSRNIEKAMELMVKDYAMIATELLEKIWHEDISQKMLDDLQRYKPGHGMENLDPKVKKIVFLGDRIWQIYRQIVQSFLSKLLSN